MASRCFVTTAVALLFLSLSPAATAVARDCEVEGNACPEQSSALMQRMQHGGASLKPHAQKRKGQDKHAGTVKLLLAEMDNMISTKGQSGMDPDEIEHIHSIKALIDDTILPTILMGVEEHKKELEELYNDILACNAHVGGVINTTDIREESVDQITQHTRDCELRENIIKDKTKMVCETLNRTRLTIYLPGDEPAPPTTATPEELIKYLGLMDDFFCGRYEPFYEEWQECEELEENYTITHQECVYLQKEMAEVSCKWKTHLTKSCDYFDTCWTEKVKKYNQRVKEILELQKTTAEEYEGASNIQCLWSAWIYEYMPCTVNKTRVRECHEYPPNLTNVTISFPPPPSPPSCSTASVEMDICSDEWININYGDLGLSTAIIEELRENCVPCESYTWTSKPVVTKHIHVFNARHIGGSAYLKTSGTTGCDAFVETDDPNVQSVTVSIPEMGVPAKVEIVTNSTTLTMELQSGTASVVGADEVAMYAPGDKLEVAISAGSAIFMKNGDPPFVTMELPEDFISGFGKVSMCGGPGSEVDADFGLIV